MLFGVALTQGLSQSHAFSQILAEVCNCLFAV